MSIVIDLFVSVFLCSFYGLLIDGEFGLVCFGVDMLLYDLVIGVELVCVVCVGVEDVDWVVVVVWCVFEGNWVGQCLVDCECLLL